MSLKSKKGHVFSLKEDTLKSNCTYSQGSKQKTTNIQQSHKISHYSYIQKKKPKKEKKKSNKQEVFSNGELKVKQIRKFGPQKFLQPLQTYDIFGFFFLYNDALSEMNNESIGLFEVINFYKKISRIERVDSKLNVLHCQDTNLSKIPYELIISRLMSLNNQKSHDLALMISEFCDCQKKILQELNEEIPEEFQISEDHYERLKEKSLMHKLAFEEIQNSNSHFKKISFANKEELDSYEKFLDDHNNFLKENQDEVFYEVRYKATPGLDYYHSMQHFYSTKYGKLICPDDTYYLTTLLQDGFPNAIKIKGDYCEAADRYLLSLYDNFIKVCQKKEETTEKAEKKENVQIFESLDGLVFPVKIELQVEIFQGRKFIEIVKRSVFTISEENQQILMSDKRKKEFIEKFKLKNSNPESGSNNNLKKTPQDFMTENEFISMFYPGVIPKNTFLKNQSKICQYRSIVNL